MIFPEEWTENEERRYKERREKRKRLTFEEREALRVRDQSERVANAFSPEMMRKPQFSQNSQEKEDEIIYFGGQKLNLKYRYYLPRWHDKVREMEYAREQDFETKPLVVTLTYKSKRKGRQRVLIEPRQLESVELKGNSILGRPTKHITFPVSSELLYRADVILLSKSRAARIKGLGGNYHKLEGKFRRHKVSVQYKEKFINTPARLKQQESARRKRHKDLMRGENGRFVSPVEALFNKGRTLSQKQEGRESDI